MCPSPLCPPISIALSTASADTKSPCPLCIQPGLACLSAVSNSFSASGDRKGLSLVALLVWDRQALRESVLQAWCVAFQPLVHRLTWSDVSLFTGMCSQVCRYVSLFTGMHPLVPASLQPAILQYHCGVVWWRKSLRPLEILIWDVWSHFTLSLLHNLCSPVPLCPWFVHPWSQSTSIQWAQLYFFWRAYFRRLSH